MDDGLIAVDKPVGLQSVATEGERADTAFARLNAYLAARRQGRPFVVHRLDRETSGLLLFARSAAGRDRLRAGWWRVAKAYLAVVEGEPRPPEGTVRNFLTEGKDLRVRASAGPRPGSKGAVTRYRVVTARNGRALGGSEPPEVESPGGAGVELRAGGAGPERIPGQAHERRDPLPSVA